MDDRTLAAQMVLWMEGHLTSPNNCRDLERISGYSENRLRQKFYHVTGETPSGYLRKRRLTEAAKALIAGGDLVDIAAVYGYSSQENFTTAFKSWFGITPGELRTTDRRYQVFLTRLKEPLNLMEISKLKQGPLCTTFISCMKGASEFWELDWTTAELFAYSAYGFMLNIHQDLCPSGPYVWNKDNVFLNLRDMGIRRTAVFEIRRDSQLEQRRQVEAKLQAHLDAGNLAMIDFLEHQLVSGYDANGFVFLQPWNCQPSNSEIKQLSFGSWSEALDRENRVWFTFLEKEALRADYDRLLRSAIDTALWMRSKPTDFVYSTYHGADAAWETWLAAVQSGLGDSHGHWWNAMVWKECRQMLAEFFTTIRNRVSLDQAEGICDKIATTYRDSAAALERAAVKGIDKQSLTAALEAGRAADAQAEVALRELRALL